MSASINFFLRGKQSANKEDLMCSIYAEISCNGERTTAFSTKLRVPVKYWMAVGKKGIKSSTQEKLISPSYALADELNEQLIQLQKLVYQGVQLLDTMELPVSANAVKNLILNPQPLRPAKKYIDVVDELIAVLKQKRKKNTMLTYRTRRKNIFTFLEKNGYSNLYINDFRFRHFEEIQLWMIEQENDNGTRQFCNNTINKHLTLVNKVLNYGVNKEYIQANPIGELGLEYDQTKPPQYLLPPDRKRIYDCPLPSLKIERDLSVFLYNTGFSYTDYLSLNDNHFFRLPSGEWFIKKPRDKSDVYSIIPLLSQAHEIIKEYGSVRKMPRPDISDLNKTLKILGDVCQSPYSLSTSTFRETFSSMMENEYMVPDRLLMFMMGHTNPRQLRNYSSVMPAKILHELKRNQIVIPFNLDIFKELVKAS